MIQEYPVVSTVLSDIEGNPINPSKEDGNLLDIKDNLALITDANNEAIKVVESLDTSMIMGMTSMEGYIYDPGHINRYVMRPTAVTESVAVTNSIKDIAPGDRLIQIFRASATNLNRIDLSLNYKVGANDLIIDDFDSYTDEAALDSVWVSTDNNQIDSSLSTDTPDGSTKCMQAYTDRNAENDYITKTYSTPLDLTSYTDLTFWWKQEARLNDVYYYIHLIDNTGQTVEHKIQINNTNTWELQGYQISSFYSISGNNFDWANVSKFRLYCHDADSRSNIFIDRIHFTRPDSTTNNFRFELYKYKNAGIPSENDTLLTDFTLCADDDGNNNIELLIDSPVSDAYQLPYEYGVHHTNNSLVVGNYYAIVLTAISTDTIQVATIDTTSFTTPYTTYTNGDTFNITSGSNTFVTLPYTSLTFIIHSVIEAYLSDISFSCKQEPGDSFMRMGITEGHNFKQLLLDKLVVHTQKSGSITFKPTKIGLDNAILMYVGHAVDSELTHFNFNIFYTYVPIVPYN